MPVLAQARQFLGRTLMSLGTGMLAERPRTQIRVDATYEGASQSRRMRGLFAPRIGPNTGVVYALGTLRDRSRASNRNDGYSRAAVNRHVANEVGTGIVPQSQAEDAPFRERLHQLFWDWCDQADADGQRDFYGLQALTDRGWKEGGEMFIRLRPRLPQDGLVVPLQLQLLEPELVPETYTTIGANGNPIRAGIEFTKIGQRAAYWCWQQRPEQLDPFAAGAAMVRIPADQILHVYDPLRAGQLRGLPQLTQALVELFDISGFKDATLQRQKLANFLVGTMSPPLGDVQADVDPISGKPIEQMNQDAVLGLEPGTLNEMPPGAMVNWSDPPAATGYGEFIREQLMAAAVAADVPYEVLTGDMRGINDRTVRVILQEFRRAVEQRQHHTLVFTMLRPIWNAFIDRAVLSGALPVPTAYWEDPTPWKRVEWIPPAWPYLHPVQDVDAYTGLRRAGLTSRARIVKLINSTDAEVIDQENAADEAREKALGLRYDYGGSAASRAPDPEPAPAGKET